MKAIPGRTGATGLVLLTLLPALWGRPAPQRSRASPASLSGPLPVLAPTNGSTRTPNVLVVLADDFNWTDLELVPTPTLDALADRGMTFRRAYAFPVCSPTRYGTLFGRYPRRDGIGEIVSVQPPGPDNPTPPLELTSLAESVKQARGGYRTGIFGKWHLGTNELYDGLDPDFGPYNFGALTPMWQGFDRWFGAMANLPDYFEWRSVDDGVFVPSQVYATAAVLDRFRQWWTDAKGPRFAYFVPHNAHAAYHAPPRDMLPPGYPIPVTNRERFEAMIASLDWVMGQVLTFVDLRDTYVFFLPDNGTPTGVSVEDCPRRPWEPFDPFNCTKHTVFEPGIRVPMIVVGPDVPPGTESSSLVSCVDLMATIGELIGAPSPGEDSISFRDTLLDPSVPARRHVFSEIFGEFRLFLGGNALKEESTAIGARYKLRRINGVETLYDLENDPREEVRLSLNDPDLADALAELRAVLDDPLNPDLQRSRP